MKSYMKRLLTIGMALLCVLSLVACGSENEEIVEEVDEVVQTTEEEVVQALDYSKEENWVDIEKSGRKAVDVFFIMPTVVDETENEDGFASVSEMESMASLIRLYQTSVYEDSCNVYMPYYRQASMNIAYACNKDNATYLDALYNGKAYLDIEAALDYYFENYNNGKPFILASHSQGSAMSINVLTHYMQEHKEYLSRMIAAYVIGFAPSEDIFNEETGLQFATGEDDVNVVISFNTEGPNAEGKTILLPEKPMVINPLNWKTDDTYASAELNKGYTHVSSTGDSLTTEQGKDDAQINLERKTIVCTTRTEDDYSVAPEAFASESFHEKEYGMYYWNLKENVQTRIDAYFAK